MKDQCPTCGALHDQAPAAAGAAQAVAVASVAEFKSEYAQHEVDIRGWVMQWARSGVSRQIAINGALNKMHDLYFAALASTPAPEVVKALRDLLDAVHQGRFAPLDAASYGYLHSLVEAGEDALKAAQPIEREDGK